MPLLMADVILDEDSEGGAARVETGEAPGAVTGVGAAAQAATQVTTRGATFLVDVTVRELH